MACARSKFGLKALGLRRGFERIAETISKS